MQSREKSWTVVEAGDEFFLLSFDCGNWLDER